MGRETVQGGQAAGKQGRSGVADGTAGRDGASWGIASEENPESIRTKTQDTAIGREFFGVRVFLHGAYMGGE